MLKLVKAAVTGHSGSGKTTVCQLFKELGAFTLSTDKIVDQLLSSRTEIKNEVIRLLGKEIVHGKGELSRKTIADIVFNDREKLLALEKILHPAVWREIEASYKKVDKSAYWLFIAEVPLLYEGGFEKHFDTVIVVTAQEALCLARSQLDEKEYTRRTARLLPIEEKVKRADFIIKNNDSLKELKEAVTTIFNTLEYTR